MDGGLIGSISFKKELESIVLGSCCLFGEKITLASIAIDGHLILTVLFPECVGGHWCNEGCGMANEESKFQIK